MYYPLYIYIYIYIALCRRFFSQCPPSTRTINVYQFFFFFVFSTYPFRVLSPQPQVELTAKVGFGRGGGSGGESLFYRCRHCIAISISVCIILRIYCNTWTGPSESPHDTHTYAPPPNHSAGASRVL